MGISVLVTRVTPVSYKCSWHFVPAILFCSRSRAEIRHPAAALPQCHTIWQRAAGHLRCGDYSHINPEGKQESKEKSLWHESWRESPSTDATGEGAAQLVVFVHRQRHHDGLAAPGHPLGLPGEGGVHHGAETVLGILDPRWLSLRDGIEPGVHVVEAGVH